MSVWQLVASPSVSWLGPRPSLRVLGTAAGVASIALYAADGYSTVMLVTWLVSLGALTVSFEPAARVRQLARRDLLIPVVTAAVFAPLYVLRVYSVPEQVGSDEVTLITVADRWANQSGVDPFGLSDYFTLPVLPFLLLGRLAELVGDVDLETMRQLHAVIGVVTVAASYAFFRQLLSWPWALAAVSVLGYNHAFFMFNRMAMHQATAVLVEVLALALLLYGLRHSASRATFLGGAVAGFAFYVYYPARAVFPLWLLFLAVLAVMFAREIPRVKVARMGGVAALAFAVVVGPLAIAEATPPAGSTDYQKTSLLILPEGRELAREWADGGSTWDGIEQNIVYGISAFNNTVQDHGWLYPNAGHGFLDPLTGVLLWIGVLLTVVRLRSSGQPWPLLALTSLLALWLTYTFVINKAPHYGRLLLTLPFVAYFSVVAIRAIAEKVPQIFGRRSRTRVVAAGVSAILLATIAAWNIAIAADFVEDGRAAGDDIGSTGRYVQARRDVSGIRFYMAASDRWPYYEWGWPSIWEDRMRIFAREGQVQPIVPPAGVAELEAKAPFVLFLSRGLWERSGMRLDARYPQGRVRSLMADGSRIAFEVAR